MQTVPNSDSVLEKAYAKINLALDVTGKLPNGYHTVKMVMETISIHDDLEITRVAEPGITMECFLQSGRLSESALSCGDDNLVIKAAKLITDEALKAGKSQIGETGIHIKLTKRIPMAAGMAGGSADAAATLRGINRLFDLGYSTEDLCIMGVSIGADVPYCIRGGSYLAEGIGEILTPLPPPPAAHILIAKPAIDVSTPHIYKQTDSIGISSHPDIDGMIGAIREYDLKLMASKLGNVLREAAVQEHVIISVLEKRMCDLGAAGALMSGSGPSVFGLFRNSDLCMNAAGVMREQFKDMYFAIAHFTENA